MIVVKPTFPSPGRTKPETSCSFLFVEERMIVVDLPLDIFKIIQSFLKFDDFHYFLNASKSGLYPIKRKVVILFLNHSKSRDYVLDVIFRQRILDIVENPWKQVDLILKGPLCDIPRDLPIHKLVIDHSEQTDSANYKPDPIEMISHIEILEKVRCRETIPLLSEAKEIVFQRAESLVDVSNLNHLKRLKLADMKCITDVTPLKNIPDITLHQCELIQDFSMFHSGKQCNLSLINCPFLVNVNNFQSIQCLSLIQCNELEDISLLYGIYDLTIKGCRKVKNISCLGKHYRFTFGACAPIVKGYESLLNIPHVNLSHCNIDDLSPLQYAKTVILNWCLGIKDLSPLVNASSINISSCASITNLHVLQKIPALSLSVTSLPPQTFLNDFQTLQNTKLILNGIHLKVNTLSFLQHCTEVTLSHTRNFLFLLNNSLELQYFKHLYSLMIEDILIEHVNAFGHIPILKLYSCPRLNDISQLGKGNRLVEIHNCLIIEDVSSLVTVPIVTIRNCHNIKDYSCLEKVVPRLKIVR